MAETNALLKRHTGNRIEGSNPSVSATMLSMEVRTGPPILTFLLIPDAYLPVGPRPSVPVHALPAIRRYEKVVRAAKPRAKSYKRTENGRLGGMFGRSCAKSDRPPAHSRYGALRREDLAAHRSCRRRAELNDETTEMDYHFRGVTDSQWIDGRARCM